MGTWVTWFKPKSHKHAFSLTLVHLSHASQFIYDSWFRYTNSKMSNESEKPESWRLVHSPLLWVCLHTFFHDMWKTSWGCIHTPEVAFRRLWAAARSKKGLMFWVAAPCMVGKTFKISQGRQTSRTVFFVIEEDHFPTLWLRQAMCSSPIIYCYLGGIFIEWPVTVGLLLSTATIVYLSWEAYEYGPTCCFCPHMLCVPHLLPCWA